MFKRVLITTALLVPVFAAAPAYAAGSVICVGTSGDTCTDSALTITAAIAKADSNGVADTILVGPGTFVEPATLVLTGTVQGITLQGSGQGQTILTMPGSTDVAKHRYVVAHGATIRDLTIQMTAADSDQDVGMFLNEGSVVDHLTIDGAGTDNTTGIDMMDSTAVSIDVQLPLVSPSGTRAIFSEGGNTVAGATVVGRNGYDHSGPTDTVSRVSIKASGLGVSTDAGTVALDDALIDLGTSGGTGLRAANFNTNTATKSIEANHVTIVGGGAASKGVLAAASNATSRQQASVELTNSIVRGPATDLMAMAGNNGSQGGPSTATITASYSDWHSKVESSAANGVAQVVSGTGNLDVDPMFVNAASGNFRLAAGSPVLDKGDPTIGGPSLDLAGGPRLFDGDADSVAERDLGAYERSDLVAPQVTITDGPSGWTTNSAPKFSFVSNEPGVTFACKVDGNAYGACSGPGGEHRPGPLPQGVHTFSVVAADVSGNTSAAPAQRTFSVDTIAPDTKLTSKPAKRVNKRRVSFGFASTEAGSSYQCKLDKSAWRSCGSPTRLKVAVGRHRFLVRATDAAGNVDATPVGYRFRRVR